MKRSLELLCGLLLAVRAVQAEPVRISIELAGDPVAGVLKLSPTSGTEPAREIAVKAPGEQGIELRPDVTWEARFVAEGFWGETLTLVPREAASVRRLRVFPAGRIHGKVALPAGEKPLPSLALRFQTSFAAAAEPLDATVVCPIEKDRFACEIPAGQLDLRLRTDRGFAPVYLWGTRVTPGKATDLGELRLRRGASVSGWVQTADGHPPSSECRLKLAPGSAATNDLKVRDQIAKATLEVAPSGKGFFQIVGVPPGRYELTARQPGSAETRVAPIDVRPDLESQVLDRLVLAPPVTFDITLDPPVEPYGSPWRIELSQRVDPDVPASNSTSGTASPEGLWHVPGVAPGTYELRVIGDQKAVWHEEFLDVKPGQSSLRIDLPVLRVEGRILIGEEPLAATLWLSRKGGRRLRFDSDDHGRFSGVLPGEGLWVPQIQSTAGRLHVALDPVEIKPSQGKNLAKVEIRVPETRLVGQVVDEAGQPVPSAQILARHLEKDATDQFVADEKGEFSIRGLHPGPLVVKAEDGERQSDFTPADVPREGDSPWLRLVVRKTQTFEGRVVSPAGGAPGAMILAWSAFNGQSAASLTQTVSAADGSFHFDLPASTTTLSLAVFPPGYAMRLLTLPVSPGQPIEIPVEPQGGSLTLELADKGPSPLLVHGGIFVVPSMLRTWARMQGVPFSASGRLVLPNVEAGPYSLCVGKAAVSSLKQGAEPPAASCTGGVLAPNGELVLRVPASLVAGST
jgi:hypothetical protein